jgi:hypothetical protein
MLLRRVAFPDFCEPCLPSPADKPPAGAGWLHEIKHDGFRMLVRRDGAGVRLFTRNGHDWTGRFPLIARATLSLKARSCLIDGEAVACDGDRVETPWLALPLRSVAALDQEQESAASGSEAGGWGRLGKGALAVSVAPENGDRNRIMIYGPKNDGTYIVEFKMADGEALAISVPREETRVLKHF